MDFSFFIENNKSGYKTKESWLKTNHTELYESIIDYSKSINLNLSFKEKIWFYYNNLKERPKCHNCGCEIKFRERFDKPYGEFCSIECFNSDKKEMLERIKKTNNEKYGVNFFTETPDFVTKSKKTKKEKYGDENYNNYEKNKLTKLKKYGNEHYNNFDKYIETCVKKYNKSNYAQTDEYKDSIELNFKKIYPDVNFYEINKHDVTIHCNECETKFTINKQLLYERSKRGYTLCTICNPIGFKSRSGYEKEISDFLNELNINHECSNRSLISKEIDIYMPDKKIGIEINGLYWHNELFVDENYHLNKTIESSSKGIDLMHIFEDEWLYKKEIVKSIISNRLGLTSNVIYGRNCIIKEISSNECNEFLNQNHIQGSVNSKVRLGLYFKDELVSVMSFSRGRVIMGGKKDEWELNRYTNKINHRVVGAASKLLNFFIKKYEPSNLISYSDLRLFGGKMYEKLGFKFISQSKPNYWYVIQNKRFYRFNFRKSILVKQGYDKNKTEKEIMFENKNYRIYDCGNIRWEMTLLK
jgi:hypothetical protein